MSISSFSSPKVLIPVLAALLACGAGVWALNGSKQQEAKPAVPQELTVASLQTAEPDKAFDSFRKAMDREDLTDEQKRQVMENGREVMEKRMEERLNEYFTAPEPDRKRILDKQIDEFEKFRKERETERVAREAEREKMTEEEREKQREKWRAMFRGRENATQAERKTRSESRSPDRTARRMAYFAAVQARMQERGIQPPQWGPGGRGGPGGHRPGG